MLPKRKETETNHLSYLLPGTGAWLCGVRAQGRETLLFATWQQSTHPTGPAHWRTQVAARACGGHGRWRSDAAALLPLVTWGVTAGGQDIRAPFSHELKQIENQLCLYLAK